MKNQSTNNDPNGQQDADINLRMANIYYAKNDLVNTEKHLVLAPVNSESVYFLGLVYLRMNRLDEAHEALEKAVQMDYGNPAAHFYLGETLFKFKAYDMALEAYIASLRINPGMDIAREKIISIYKNVLKKPDLAVAFRKR